MNPTRILTIATVALTIVFCLLFLSGCAGVPFILNASYSGTTKEGHEFSLGATVPFSGRSGKQIVRAQK